YRTCVHGHRWDSAVIRGDGSTELVCPECGSPAQFDSTGTAQEQGTVIHRDSAEPTDQQAGTRFIGAPSEKPAKPVERVTVPGYQITGELGRGGMGVVYHALQAKLNRPVALKMVLTGVHASSEEVQRFKAEAEAIARLQHPNIVQIYEVGEADGRPYFSLEF